MTGKNCLLIIVGRSQDKLTKTIDRLKQKYPTANVAGSCFDIYKNLDERLKELKPFIVIHTSGPFQNQDYIIPKTCIENHAHYLDIADAREYVRDISTLNDLAMRNNVAVISGASSVPGLTSAVIEEYKPTFSEFDHLKFSISSGQQTPGGVESSFLHLSLWCMSWLVRWGMPIRLGKYSNLFYRVSKSFDRFGSDAGGLYIFLSGKDLQGKPKSIKWFIVARKNHGLYIPTIPAIVLAKKIFRGEYSTAGAKPCVGLVSLKELLSETNEYDISVFN